MVDPVTGYRYRKLFIAFLVVVGCLLRIYPMLGYYYNSDEMLHLGIASASSLKQVWEYSLYETHPPLGHFIRHFWMMLGGDGIWWNRSLSMVFGLLLIPLMYLCGKAVSGRQAGIIAAIITTFVPHAVTVSNVVRNYSISAFFTAAAILFFFRYAQTQTRKNFCVFAIFALLSTLTHYTNIIVLFALMGTFAFRAIKERKPGEMLLFSGLGIVILLITVMMLFQHGNRVDSYVSATPRLSGYLENPVYAWDMAGQALQFLILTLISLFVSPLLMFGDIGGLISAILIFALFALAVVSRDKSAVVTNNELLLRWAFAISLPVITVGAFCGFFGFSLIRRTYSLMQLGTLLIAIVTAGPYAKQAHKVFVVLYMALIATVAIVAISQDQRRIEGVITESEWVEFARIKSELAGSNEKNLIYADLPVMVSLLWQKDDYYKFLEKYRPFDKAALYPFGRGNVLYRYDDVRNNETMASLKETLKSNSESYDNVVFIALKLSEGRHVDMVRKCIGKFKGSKTLLETGRKSLSEVPDVYIVSVPAAEFKKEVIEKGNAICMD